MYKKKAAKLSALFLAGVLALSVTACKKKGENKGDAAVTTQLQSEQTTAAATTEKQEETTAASSEPTETEKKEDVVLSPLSGRKIKPEERNRRVIAVSIDNHPEARQQAGWSQADMVLEMKVEGTYTRYMALFQSQDAPLVGPIRSARAYYIDRMQEFEAVYTHFGGSNEASDILSDPRYAEIDGMVVPSDVIWRYNDTGKYAPHNAYSDTVTLRNYAEDLGYDPEVEIKGYKFNEEPKQPAGDAANSVEVVFAWDNVSQFEYDDEAGKYTFTKDYELQVDENNQEPVMIQNIIIQCAEYGVSPYGLPLLSCAQIGTGEGYYISQGKCVPIVWEKESAEAQTMYYTADGKELVLNPGLTWVEVTDTDSDITIG